MAREIKGIKLIRHNAAGINLTDDPSFPFKLEVSFRPPEFMDVAFVFMHGGSEEIVVRGLTLEALEEFSKVNNLERHPRLRRLTITGPNGVVREVKK